jgi:hypothetical protein
MLQLSVDYDFLKINCQVKYLNTWKSAYFYLLHVILQCQMQKFRRLMNLSRLTPTVT